MRKLATIRKISEIETIPSAQYICTYVISGWKVVDSIGKYVVGDLVVYLEIDSWVPNEIAPFLTPEGKEPKVYNGVKGERLRTKKIRGVLSQGLILPFDTLFVEYEGNIGIGDWKEGEDVTELLGIQKWEPTIPIQLRGLAKGNFPSWVPKTDQERCLSGDTIIETNIGKIKISDIVNKHLPCNALSFNKSKDTFEYMPVIGYSVVENESNWVEITLDNGTIIRCTEDHKIWSNTALDYVEAQQLLEGDILMVIND